MKQTRFATLLSLILSLSLLLAGCSGGSGGGQNQSPAPSGGGGKEDTPLKVGLIVSGTVNDNGWCASAYDGLLAIQEQFGADINYVENVGMSDIESQLINYGEEGYDVVFCHGFEYTDSVMKVGPTYPDTWYAVNSTDAAVQEPNVLSVSQNNLHKGFLAGVVAALVTESNTIGAIGGTDIPAVQLSLEGAVVGAKYINPDINVITTITGDNEDTTAALEVANAMANQGADVLIPVLGSAGLATLTVAEEQGLLVVGTNSDMHEFGPDVVVNSSIAGFVDAMPAIMRELQAGKLEPKAYSFGIAEDVVKLVSFYEFGEKLPQETLDKVSEIVESVKNGTLVVEDLPK